MRGLSLLEIILSFCIVALMIIAVLSLYPAATATVRLSGQKLQADALATSLIEEYSAAPFASLVPGPGPALTPVEARGAILVPSVEFERVNDPEVPLDLLRRIRVTVTWTERGMTREHVREVIRANVRR